MAGSSSAVPLPESVSFNKYTTEQVVRFIGSEIPTLSLEIREIIKDQKIDGEVLLEMSDNDLLEIAPLLGDRLKLKKAMAKARSLVHFVS